jgi:hypothetical protein
VKTSIAIASMAGAALLANIASAPGQTTCQPTIMNPCPPPKLRADNQPSMSKADPNKSDQSQSGLRRGLSVAPDTTLGLGPRGLGLNGKF